MGKSTGKPYVAWKGDWQDVIDSVTGPRTTPVARRRTGDSWGGGEGWDKVVDRVRFRGYEEVVPEVEASAVFIEQGVIGDAVLDTFHSVYDTSGSDVDITRYLNGDPECMTESLPIRLAKQGRIVTLIAHVGVAGSVGNQAIKNRGAAIAALINVLLVAQHPMEVWVMDNYPTDAGRGATKGWNGCVIAQVQAADQPLDKARLMFALAHPAMLRSVLFDVVDGLKDEPLGNRIAGSGQGYGPVVDMEDEHFVQCGFDREQVVYVPQLESEWYYDPEVDGHGVAIKWVESELARLGIDVH